MYCARCGKELAPGAAYCSSCGAGVGAPSPADWWWQWRRERLRHEWEPWDAAWGAIRAVGFLVIVGMMFFLYPDVFTISIRYLESWGTYGQPVLPPRALGQVLIFLFTVGGVWGLVSSGLRLAFTSRMATPLRGVIGASFSLYDAFIFSAFYAGGFRGAELVLLFFLGLAAMVVADSLVTHYVGHRKGTVQGSPGWTRLL